MTDFNLFVDEDTIIDSYDLGAVIGADGRLFRIDATNPNPLTIKHKLDRFPKRFIVTHADRDVRIWQTNINEESFDLFRSDPSAILELWVL